MWADEGEFKQNLCYYYWYDSIYKLVKPRKIRSFVYFIKEHITAQSS